jgi:hypothetical protein
MSEIYLVEDLEWENNSVGNSIRPALIRLQELSTGEAAVLLADLQTLNLNDERPLWEILGLAVPLDTAWKELRIGELKTLLALAVGDEAAIREGCDWIHQYKQMNPRRRLVYRCIESMLKSGECRQQPPRAEFALWCRNGTPGRSLAGPQRALLRTEQPGAEYGRQPDAPDLASRLRQAVCESALSPELDHRIEIGIFFPHPLVQHFQDVIGIGPETFRIARHGSCGIPAPGKIQIGGSNAFHLVLKALSHFGQRGIFALLKGRVKQVVLDCEVQLDGGTHRNDQLGDFRGIIADATLGECSQGRDARNDFTMLLLEFVDVHQNSLVLQKLYFDRGSREPLKSF